MKRQNTLALALAAGLAACALLQPVDKKTGQETLLGKAERVVASVVVAAATTAVTGNPIAGAAAGGATAIALEPSHPTNVTNITNEKGGTTVLNQAMSHSFLGLSGLTWGIIIGQLAQLLLRNRRIIGAMISGRIPRGQWLRALGHMLVGGLLDQVRSDVANPTPPPPAS